MNYLFHLSTERYIHGCMYRQDYTRKIKGWDTLTPAGQGYGGNLSPLPYISTNGAHIWKKIMYFFWNYTTFCKKCIFTIENPKKQMPDFAWYAQWRPLHTQNLFCCLQLDPNTSTRIPGLLTDPNVMKLEKHLSTLHKYLKKGDSE